MAQTVLRYSLQMLKLVEEVLINTVIYSLLMQKIKFLTIFYFLLMLNIV